VIGRDPATADRPEVRNRVFRLIVVDRCTSGKQLMADRADGFLVLPGGTDLDETFEC